MAGKSFFIKPFYPFLLSVFFVVHGFSENFFLIPVKDALVLLFIYLVSTIGLFFLCWLYFKNTVKAALFTFLLMGFNFFFGYLYDTVKSFFSTLYFPGSFALKYTVIISVALLAFAVTAIILKKWKSIPQKVSVYLNLVLFVFILIDLAFVIKKNIFPLYNKDLKLAIENVSVCTKTNLPDVYLIIADEYAGSKELTNIFSFDNSSFLDLLRQKGFFVANNSRSNYGFTTYSMASLLNMDYLDLKRSQANKIDNLFTLKLVCDNKLCTFFKETGYNVHNYSVFDINGQFTQEENSFVPARTKLFTSQTLLNRLKDDVWLTVAKKLHLKSVVENSLFENLKYNHQIFERTVKTINSRDTIPKFIYTHFELPHFPYYYDQNGNLYSNVENIDPGDRAKYIQYLRYTNTVLLKIVDEIIQSNKTPPVIILMSDH